MKLTSPSFKHGGPIPAKFTGDGANISPQLVWHDAPKNTKSFLLICDDPDAPGGTWVHWIVFNLASTVHELPEKAEITRYSGAYEGKNSWGKNKYGGPFPPKGTHRYFFKLYALDIMLPEHDNATKADVEQSMAGHVLAQAELMGTYQRVAP